MTPQQWQRIRPILESALELDPASRPAFLDGACEDAALRHEVDSLIAAREQNSNFLECPAVAEMVLDQNTVSVAAWTTGMKLGPYEIHSWLGAGGMGEVYRAFRADDEYTKQVAIKLVRAGQNSDFVLNRFKNERQILASLDHPNIARLLDGGTTENGVPYFVMELIEGHPIDDYCDNHKLPTSDRLKLFLQVCSAVQYAHQHLFVHRDIKPSNVLVTSDGVPKLLDFGIAKILEGSDVAGQFEPTLTVLRVLTPGYASPEQIKGEAVTTASDVYSLGVVLYELLCGHSPYRLASRTPHELSRAVCEFEPEKPSVAIRWTENGETGDDAQHITPARVSGVRDGSPVKLSRRLNGDLDNIVLMALRKEPQRRYASVEQLGEDIRRHLEHRPVWAREDTFRYRSGKFIRRHRVGVVAAALVSLTIAAGLVAVLWEANIARQQAEIAKAQSARADRRFNEVRKLANSLIFDLRDPIHVLPGSVNVEKTLVTTGLQYLDSLAQESGGDPALQRELAEAYKRLGDTQGSPYARNLGDSAGALASYKKALQMRLAVLQSAPQGIPDQIRLATNYRTLGRLCALTGDRAAARENMQLALQTSQPFAEAHPGDPSVLRELSSEYTTQADIEGEDLGLGTIGNPVVALQYHLKALETDRKWVASTPGEKLPQQQASYDGDRVANDLIRLGRLAEGLQYERNALSILEHVSQDDAIRDPSYLAGLTRAIHGQLGDALLLEGRPAEAVAEYKIELAGGEYLLHANPPEDAYTRFALGASNLDFGKGLMHSGTPKAGLRTLNRGVQFLEQLLAADPLRSENTEYLANGYVFEGEALERMHDEPGALRSYSRATELFNSPVRYKPGDFALSIEVAASQGKMAHVQVKLGRLSEADQNYHAALRLMEPAAKAKPPSLHAQYIVADIYAGLGDMVSRSANHADSPSTQAQAKQQACEWYRKSLAIWQHLPVQVAMAPNTFEIASPQAVGQEVMLCAPAHPTP